MPGMGDKNKKPQVDEATQESSSAAADSVHAEAHPSAASSARADSATRKPPSPYSSFIRAENEDDDGYDPYSDRPARPEPLFERDPWD